MDENKNNNQPGEAFQASLPKKHAASMLILLFGAVVIIAVALVVKNFKGMKSEMTKLRKENLLLKSLPTSNKELPAATGTNKAEVPVKKPAAPASKMEGTIIQQEYVKDFIAKGQMSWSDPDDEDGKSSLLGAEKIVEVGKITGGNYEGYHFYLAFYPTMMGSDIIRYISNGEKIIVLKKYSPSFNYVQSEIKADIPVVANEGIIVEDLDVPELLYGLQEGQILKHEYPEVLFNKKAIRIAFEHEKMGTVWTTDWNKVGQLDEKDLFSDDVRPFKSNGFYVKRADSTAAVYSLVINKDTILDITWNNGKEADYEEMKLYSEVAHVGCGAATYISVVQLSTDELEAAGKNSEGETIYILKDDEHQLLSEYYESRYWENDNKMDYDEFVDQKPLLFWVDPFGRMIRFENQRFTSNAECGKPVIYLYPEQTTDVEVKVSPVGGFTFTEPEYHDSWKVVADPDGRIVNKDDNKEYPYLFWEGRGGLYQMPSKGFVVERENLSSFLDEKLAQQGFIAKEIADFKEFWLPRMEAEQKPYYFVTFMGNRVMEQIAPLEVSPQPDTVIRVLMDYRGLDSRIEVEPLELKTPAREGFTVTEWGGVINK